MNRSNMKRFMSKKVAVVGLAVALVIGIGGAAFAYFTSTGTGTGSAVVGTSSNLTLIIHAAA
jgi:tetrahydromethanopterin S-methyltransferase subunit D